MHRLAIIAFAGMLLVAPAVASNTAATSAAAPATAPSAGGGGASATTDTSASGPTAGENGVTDDSRLSNFADLFFSGTVGENAPELQLDFGAGTALGSQPLSFEKTRLDDLQKAYGGTLHGQGDAGDGVTWLCFTQHARAKGDTPRTVWFTSTNEMADTGSTLSMVVVQDVDAATASGCATAPAGFTFPSFGVPSLGASIGDLKTKFGPLKRDRQGNVYFNSTRPLADGSGMSTYQSLGYVVSNKGSVTGIALSQVTTD